MYDVFDYGRMAEDEARVSAYLAALASVITPDSVVLDLGTGIGLFAIAAAQLGARHVYAVDLTDAVLLGPELARAAGVAERVTFLHGSAWDMALPEKVDVLFYDLRGASPLFADNFRLVAAVSDRWLKVGGVHFPAKDRLFAALVRAPGARASLDGVCAAVERMGIPSGPMRASLINKPMVDTLAPLAADDVLTASFRVAELVYGEPPPRGVSGTGALAVERAGIADGVALWFETELTSSVRYDTAPGKKRVHPRMILPLASPLSLTPGDEVSLALSAITDGGEWAWSASVRRSDGTSVAGARQSTFLGRPTSIAALLAGAPTSTPTLNAAGRELVERLSAFDGTTTLEALARRLARTGSEDASAQTMVMLRDLAAKYAR